MIVNYLEEKKAENLTLIDIKNLAIFTDYFIICSGTSERMLSALAKSVTELIHQNFHLTVYNEGTPKDGWLLVDAGDIIIHVFSPEKRNYYKLEDLWSQGKILLHVQ